MEAIHASQERAAARLHRFYVAEQVGPRPAPSYLIQGEESKHALRSLRLKEGDEVELCDGQGSTVRCSISSVDKGAWKAWLTPIAEPVSEPWLGPEWVLAVGCLSLKGGRAEWLVEKATELGARELIPLATERSPLARGTSKYKSKGSRGSDGDGDGEDYQPGRMERVAIAATKQSLRAHGLRLRPPMGMAELLVEVRGSELALLAAAGAPPASRVLEQLAPLGPASRPASQDSSETLDHTSAPLRERQHEPPATSLSAPDSTRGPAPSSCGRRLLLVGPEGDFTPDEVRQLLGAGASAVGLGGNRLRTETAAIALLALCVLRS